MTPSEFDETQLHPGVKAELRGLPKDLAETIAAHIWAAGQLIDVDPALAFRHAEAARRRAGRLPIVREAAAETAYAAGEYAVALREFRAIRRMSGGDELIPLIADCERALGRHREALEVLNELNPKNPDVNLHIECLLVEAGIRDDLGQRDEALRLLNGAISRKVGPAYAQARLHYALANLLEANDDLAAARRWFTSASELDRSAELDTADRLAALDGVTLPEDFSEEDFSEEDEEDYDTDDDSFAEEDSEDADFEPGSEEDEDADAASRADEDMDDDDEGEFESHRSGDPRDDEDDRDAEPRVDDDAVDDGEEDGDGEGDAASGASEDLDAARDVEPPADGDSADADFKPGSDDDVDDDHEADAESGADVPPAVVGDPVAPEVHAGEPADTLEGNTTEESR